MKRSMVAVLLVSFAVGTLRAPSMYAQDDAQATITALQTETSRLQTEVAGSDATQSPSTVAPTAEPTIEPTATSDIPGDIPGGSEKATISGFWDGDKIRVNLNGEEKVVHLVGSDAPEIPDDGDLGECFAKESSDRLRRMLPEGRTVYLERDDKDKDKDDRLWRYVWFIGKDRSETHMANRIMIGEGYSIFTEEPRNDRHNAEFRAEQEAAKERNVGLWSACDGGHKKITPTPEPTATPSLGEGGRPAGMGETVTDDGLAITVSNPQFLTEFGFSAPRGGYVFLLVDVTIENVSDDDKNYGEDFFSATDLDTEATFDNLNIISGTGMGSGELSPGEYVSGQVILEIQETASRVRVKFDTSPIAGGENLYWIVE